MAHKILAAIVLMLLPQEKIEAEELLKKSSEKLAAAKSFQCKSQLIVHGPIGDLTMEHTFRCASGNKLFLEVRGKLRNKDFQCRIVSDGAKLCVEQDGKRTDSETPEDLNKTVLTMIPRVSLMGAVTSMACPVPGDGKPLESVEYSDFKMGKAEKSGDRELYRIEYKVTQVKPTRLTQSVETPCTLWIDSKTLLPVQRDMKVKLGNGDHIFRETFSEMKVDEKIDPAKFELPKETK